MNRRGAARQGWLGRWFGPSPETRALLSVGVPRWLRPRTALSGAVVLLLAAAMTFFLLMQVAVADPPVNPCRDGGSGGNSCSADNGAIQQQRKEAKEAKEKSEKERKKATSQAAFDKLVAERKEKQSINKGVLSSFDVRDRDGSPVSVYDVQADTGDWKQWDQKVQHFLVQVGFQINLWIVCFACWLISWALSFSLAAILLKPVIRISDSLYNNVLVEMGLPELFLTFAGVTAAWHWMFGRRSRGWGEMTAALIISALAAGALASPATMLLSEKDGAVGQARQLSVEVAALTLSDLDPDSPDQATTMKKLSGEISRPVTDALVDTFVVRTSMLLSYGQVFTGKCGADFRDVRVAQGVYQDALDEARAKRQGSGVEWMSGQLEKVPGVGKWLSENRRQNLDKWMDALGQDTDDSDEVWQDIINAGPIQDFEKKCVKGSAAAAKQASPEKSVGVFFLVIAALIVMALIVVIVAAFLNAQFWIAFEAALAKCALIAGILPGPGRAFLWQRATNILKNLGLLVASIASLAIFIVILTALIEARQDEIPGGIVPRFIILDFAAIAGFTFRKRVANQVRNLSERARHRLGNSNFGGTAFPDSSNGAAPRSKGWGRTLATAALLTAGPLGVGMGGASAGRWAARRGIRRAVGCAARGTAGTVGVLAQGSGIIGRAGATGARAVGTSSGRAALASRATTVRSRLHAGQQHGLPDHVPSSAAGLQHRMTRLRNARTARDRLATVRAARTTPATTPTPRTSWPAARPATGTPSPSSPAAGRAPVRSGAAAAAAARRTSTPPSSTSSDSGGPGPRPRSGGTDTQFTPPAGRPPVMGPHSAVRRGRGRRS